MMDIVGPTLVTGEISSAGYHQLDMSQKYFSCFFSRWGLVLISLCAWFSICHNVPHYIHHPATSGPTLGQRRPVTIVTVGSGRPVWSHIMTHPTAGCKKLPRYWHPAKSCFDCIIWIDKELEGNIKGYFNAESKYIRVPLKYRTVIACALACMPMPIHWN